MGAEHTDPCMPVGTSSRPDGSATLIVSRGAEVMAYPVGAGRQVVIGRDPAADVVVDDPAVSRLHLRIVCDDELAAIDLGSRNGTFLGDHRLEPDRRTPLGPGDVLRLGQTMLLVQHPLPPEVGASPAREGLHGVLRAACASAGRHPFGYVLVETPRDDADPDGDAPRAVIANLLRATDRVASTVSGAATVHEIVLAGARRPQVIAARARLLDHLHRQGAAARAGAAAVPVDGTGWEQVAARAWADLAYDGEPDPMAEVRAMIERVAPSDLSVLILGETGVGKEHCAERLHAASPRADRPLLRLNCAAIRDALLESELFGHERGAFTGAVAAKPGLLETANRGTVFLDEVGDLPLEVQAKLLRVLEDRQVLRLGALQPRRIDVRFIAATNRPLEEDVAAGRFRRDLYFRLAGVQIAISPLRERRREIAGLARVFAAAAAARGGRPRAPEVTPEAIAALEAWPWPGNVRELRHAIERAVLLAGDEPIRTIQLGAGGAIAAPGASGVPTRPLRDEVAERERELILRVLDECGGNQTEAARRLRISRSTLNARLDAYGVSRPRKR